MQSFVVIMLSSFCFAKSDEAFQNYLALFLRNEICKKEKYKIQYVRFITMIISSAKNLILL
jgi:hypothetical protein